MKKLPDDPWIVYILRCADGSLYSRVAKDVKRRCQQHNERLRDTPVAVAQPSWAGGRNSQVRVRP